MAAPVAVVVVAIALAVGVWSVGQPLAWSLGAAHAAERTVPSAPCSSDDDSDLSVHGRPPARAALAGTYRCGDPGDADQITAVLRLEPNGHFGFELTGPREGDAGAEAREIGFDAKTNGHWLLSGRMLTLVDDSTPPVMSVECAWFDPTVAASIDVRTADGKPARDLGVVWEQDGAEYAFDGPFTVPLDHGRLTGAITIGQDGGAAVLGQVEVVEGRQNSFRLRYDPRARKPRNFMLIVADASEGGLILPLGIGGAVLRRDGHSSSDGGLRTPPSQVAPPPRAKIPRRL